MTPVNKYVELSNHVVLPYVEQGDSDGLPVLLLHGVSDSHRSFEPVLAHLPKSIHAFALTQRGHGDASRPVSGYRFSDFSSDVAAFMDALHIESAIVVGHSMGSSVAQRFAIDYPERASALVLVGSFATLRGNRSVQELWDSVILKMTEPVDEGFVRDFQQSTLAQAVPRDFFEMVVAESLKVPARVWRAAFKGFLEDDFRSELYKITAPTLILWGDKDAFCPRSDQDLISAAIKDSRLVVYAGAGHALHWEQPDRFASDLIAFTESLAGCAAHPASAY